MTKLDLPTPNGWELKKLGDSDISEIVMGQSPPGSTYNNEQKGMPFFQGKKDFGEKFPTPRVWCAKPIRIAKKNDILLSVRAPVGATNWAKEDCCIGRGLCAISVKIEPYFIYYFLKLLENKLSTSGRGGVFKAIKRDFIYEIPINVPPRIQTQKKIVQKLDEILRQLEEKKKIIFSIIEQNSKRIDFFEKNWLHYIIDREIEKHPQQRKWKKTTVGNEIEFAYGKNLPKTKRIKGDFPVYGSNGIVGSHHEFLIDFPSIVIGRKGTVGSVHKANAKFWPTDVSFYVKINDSKKLELDFAYFLLLHLNLPKYRQSGPKSGLNRHDAYKIEFFLPPISTQKQIAQKIKNAEEKFKTQKTQFESIKKNYENTINHINHLQPSILDAAFSGKLV